MTSIVKACEKDFQLLSEIAKRSFIESHGRSARHDDILIYVTANYSDTIIKEELSDVKNIYHIIYFDNHRAGYSKIIFDTPYPGSKIKNITKLERLYLLKEFYNLKLGWELFHCNVDIMDRQCTGGRIASKERLASDVTIWSKERNDKQCNIQWKFTRQDADKKLSKHYVA